MKRWIFLLVYVTVLFSEAVACFPDQVRPEQGSEWLAKFPIEKSAMELTRAVQPGTYVEAVGRHAAVIGEEQGSIEVWVYPFKIMESFQLSIVPQGESRIYTLDELAVRITVRPESVTRTFVGDEFTLHEHIFVPIDEEGAIILLDFNTDEQLSAVFSFSPALELMWPGGLGGQYSYWDENFRAFIITESRRKYAGIIGCPLGRSGSSTPAHELPGGGVQFEVVVEPDVARQFYVPIVVAGSVGGVDDAKKTYDRILGSIRRLYHQTRVHYCSLQDQFLSIETPDEELNLAFEWAKVAVDKGFACNPHLGCGLVAGFGPSGVSERPGFAWYFGGDAFMNSFAINSYGDFTTTRQALTFLRQYQRDDGKMMHELSQSGGMIPWFEEYPYCYYHADTTPYYIVAVRDYVRVTNDIDFLQDAWESVQKAYEYCLSCETDGDGLMENTQAGMGAVEVGTLLQQSHTDIYLAGIWVRALESLGEMAGMLGEHQLAEECQRFFEKARRSLNEEFWNEEKRIYNFALATDGGVIDEVTAWPAVPLVFGLLDEQRAASMLDVFASSQLSTDWGVRMLSNRSEAYEPLSYNNGAVWPFLTGYTSWAEYKNHRPLSGYQHLMDMVRLIRIDALGYNTELLSGDRYKPLQTSVPHQIFSSSYIVTSAVRGLLGLDGDAEKRIVTFAPHVPLHWGSLHVRNFHVGGATFDFHIYTNKREGRLALSMDQQDGENYRLVFSPAFGPGSEIREVTVDDEGIDYRLMSKGEHVHCQIELQPSGWKKLFISFSPGIEFHIPERTPHIGDRSSGLRVINSYLREDELIIRAEGCVGEHYQVSAVIPFPVIVSEGESVSSPYGIVKEGEDIIDIILHFPDGQNEGYIEKQFLFQIEK